MYCVNKNTSPERTVWSNYGIYTCSPPPKSSSTPHLHVHVCIPPTIPFLMEDSWNIQSRVGMCCEESMQRKVCQQVQPKNIYICAINEFHVHVLLRNMCIRYSFPWLNTSRCSLALSTCCWFNSLYKWDTNFRRSPEGWFLVELFRMRIHVPQVFVQHLLAIVII